MTLFIKNSLREKLKRPIGKLMNRKGVEKILEGAERVITVGDISSKFFSKRSSVSIVDFRTRRNKHVRRVPYDFKVFNPPGTITSEAVETIRFSFFSDGKKTIYVDGEEDLLALPSIMLLEKNDYAVYGIGGKFAVASADDKPTAEKMMSEMKKTKYNYVVAAGTFDRFHSGHRYFLKMASFYGKHVMIGITSNEMARAKDNNIEDFNVRKNNVSRFMKSINAKFLIFEINDVYGFCLTNDNIDAIVATEDTYENVIKINEKRKQLGMKELNIFFIPYLKKNGRKISSSDIRLKNIVHKK